MTKKRTKPYGTWKSPLSASDAASAGKGGLGDLRLDGSFAYLTQARPAEGGRTAILRIQLDAPGFPHAVILPAPWSCRSRVHEYGGGAYAVTGGIVYFVHQDDQRIYRLVPSEAVPTALTPNNDARYGDLTPVPGTDYLLAIREVHESGTVTNELVCVGLSDGSVDTLASGGDFYAAPVLNPAGTQLAWIQWDHPNMPWDETALWVADFDRETGTCSGAQVHLSGAAIAEPQFAPDGRLICVTDRSGWWRVEVVDSGECLTPVQAEFTYPLWNLGVRSYAFFPDGGGTAIGGRAGSWQLYQFTGSAARPPQCTPVPGPGFTDLSSLQIQGQSTFYISSGPTAPPAVQRFDGQQAIDIFRAGSPPLDSEFISIPSDLSFECADGHRGHAFYYGPLHADLEGLPGERPPTIVRIHGGPTACASPAFRAAIQYWTTRGFAVLDVNYRGSTTFGRAYREALQTKWAAADVDDCIAAATAAAAQGLADPQRMLISGGSAGGLTVLSALTFHETFAAGACYYGIGDLELLAQDTHKFEARYLDGLVGPYPEQAALYRSRSPLHAAPPRAPVIFFHGLEDRVVPPNQTETMVAAMQNAGMAVEYLSFEGEGHGFRKLETNVSCLEAELAFYTRVLELDS